MQAWMLGYPLRLSGTVHVTSCTAYRPCDCTHRRVVSVHTWATFCLSSATDRSASLTAQLRSQLSNVLQIAAGPLMQSAARATGRSNILPLQCTTPRGLDTRTVCSQWRSQWPCSTAASPPGRSGYSRQHISGCLTLNHPATAATSTTRSHHNLSRPLPSRSHLHSILHPSWAPIHPIPRPTHT